MTNFWIKKPKSAKMNRPFKKAVKRVIPDKTQCSSVHRNCDKLPLNSVNAIQYDLTLNDLTLCNINPKLTCTDKFIFSMILPLYDLTTYSNEDCGLNLLTHDVWDSWNSWNNVTMGILWRKDEKDHHSRITSIMKGMSLAEINFIDIDRHSEWELIFKVQEYKNTF